MSSLSLPVVTPIVTLRNFGIACPPGEAIFECPGTPLSYEPRPKHLVVAEIPSCNNIPCSQHPFEKQEDDEIYGTPDDVERIYYLRDPYPKYDECFECRAHQRAVNMDFMQNSDIQMHWTEIMRDTRADQDLREAWWADFRREARLRWGKWQLNITGNGPKYYWEKNPKNLIFQDPIPLFAILDYKEFLRDYPVAGDPPVPSDSE